MPLFQGHGQKTIKRADSVCFRIGTVQELASCTDTQGSFTCACHVGWETSDAGVTCTDVVECGVSDNCDGNAVCMDGDGSFTCACHTDFEGDGVTSCIALKECSAGGSDAEACVVTFTAKMAVNKAGFDKAMQEKYVSAVARAGRVPSASITIQFVREVRQARRLLLAAEIEVDTAITSTEGPNSSLRSAVAGRLKASLAGTGIPLVDTIVMQALSVTELKFRNAIPDQSRVLTPATIEINFKLRDFLSYTGTETLVLSFKVGGQDVQEHDWIKILELEDAISLTGQPGVGKWEIEVTATAGEQQVSTYFTLEILPEDPGPVTESVPFVVGMGVGVPVILACCSAAYFREWLSRHCCYSAQADPDTAGTSQASHGNIVSPKATMPPKSQGPKLPDPLSYSNPEQPVLNPPIYSKQSPNPPVLSPSNPLVPAKFPPDIAPLLHPNPPCRAHAWQQNQV